MRRMRRVRRVRRKLSGGVNYTYILGAAFEVSTIKLAMRRHQEDLHFPSESVEAKEAVVCSLRSDLPFWSVRES